MTWQATACILCSRNCGIEVELDGPRLARIRGDDKHPLSEGYLCQKAARLDHYQNHADRLDTPLRRRADGSFEKIDWDTAIAEIAVKLSAIKAAHGGPAFAFVGGGGQGNHLGGAYSRGLVDVLGTRFHYSALAQEKTGDFWVNGKLFGRQTCHMTEGVEDAELVVLIGTNPWQAHGIRNARDTLKALGKDPARKLVVIDPRRSESAALADLHLAVRPSTDAFLLAAVLALLVRDGQEDRAFLAARTTGFEAVRKALLEVPIDDFLARSGIDRAQAETLAGWLAEAKSASIRVDLGLQQSLHSTLNSYLEKLLALVTGHFGRHGCNTLHSLFVPLAGHTDDGKHRTTVHGVAEIAKLYPPNALPAEIDSDHPGRVRAVFVDSCNPIVTSADTAAYRAAFAKLELCVVVDVAMTETAQLAHYVLPAASQFEKWETTFFNLEFPTQVQQLRRPLFPARPGTLPEPEIYRRLLVAMGELPAKGFPALRRLARLDRRLPKLRLFPVALQALLRARPRLAKVAAFVLEGTLGQALPDGMAALAPLWAACHQYAAKHGDAVRRTGLPGRGADLGEALWQRLLASPSGARLSTHVHDDVWSMIRHEDGRIHLEVPEMLAQLAALRDEPASEDRDFPLVLIAGERRAYNANQIFRDPSWRRTDGEGALHLHRADGARLGLADGAAAICESARGRVSVRVALVDNLQPGLCTLPHGYGMEHPDGSGRRVANGPAINRLTDASHRDPVAATPYHKHVRVRVVPAQ